METEWQLAWYVVWYNGHLMTDVERRGLAHLIGTMKITKGRSDLAAHEKAIRSRRYSEWLSWDPEALRLASVGWVAFVMRTVARILDDCPNKVLLNLCHRCAGLARTPRASSAVSAGTIGIQPLIRGCRLGE